ncbi:hypothetical protein PanWU01x14_213660, partial [Parasponia andersonii]
MARLSQTVLTRLNSVSLLSLRQQNSNDSFRLVRTPIGPILAAACLSRRVLRFD